MNLLSHLISRFGRIGLFLSTVFTAMVIVVPVSAETSATVLASQCVPATRDAGQLFGAAELNRCPQANAGMDLPVELFQEVPLDASRSVDLDGQRLSFEWTVLRKPSGSAVAIDNASGLRAGFTPDLAGDYLFELTVTDSAGGVAKDTVTFSTDNVAPVANAGSDVTLQVGQMASLDAVRSYDLDNDVLAYQWTLVEQPEDSNARLNASDAARSSLVLDSEGDYRIELKVKDQARSSAGAELTLSTYNSAPVANAGRARVVGPNSTLVFDSNRSSDFDADALSYHWSVLAAPEGFRGTFNSASIDNPTLTVGEAGLYLIQLMVDDGVALSNPATTLIEVKRDRLANFDLEDFLPLTNRNGGDDTDGDGVLDPVDNCVLVANAAQRDTDGDGLGNFCDADLNNDGIVNFVDITLFTPLFLGSDEDADFNGDGTVNFLDYIIITNAFLQPPGPPGTIVWVSLVDGNFGDRLNWEPQVVPSAGTTAIIDVAPAVTVTQSGGNIQVKNLVQNENLVLSGTTFEATGALELGGTASASATTLNNTLIVPSLAGTGALTLNAGTHTWSNNTIAVPTTLSNAALVNNSNGLTVDDTLTIDAPSSPTGVQFVNNQTLGGVGSIIMNGVGNSQITEPRLFPLNFTTLTIASGLTIRGGKGTVGQTFADLVMNGNLLADVSGETLQIGGTLWSGNPNLTAQNGGNVSLFGNFDNLPPAESMAGAAITMDTGGGSANLLAGAAIRNTTINGAPGTNITINSGTTNFQNLVINADFNMVNAATTNVADGLTLNGSAFIDASASPTGLVFLNSQTLGGTATIVLDGVDNSVISEPRLFPVNFTTLTIGPDVTVRGGKGKIGQINADLVLSGDVIADVADETLLVSGSTWSSTGTLTATNGGAIQLQGNFNNGGNAVTFDTGSGSINLLSGASLRNATINGAAGTDLTINTGVTNMESLVFNGDMNMVNGAVTNVTSGLTLNGTLTIVAPSSPTGLSFINSQTLDGEATVIIDGTGNSVSSEPRLFPVNFTTLTVGADVTIRGGNGTIGQSFANLIMLGDVIADVAGEELLIGGTTWSANSSIQAINDGELRFFGSLDNSGSALNLDAADGVVELLSGAALANAVFNGTPGTNMLVRLGVTTLTAMTINHDVTHENGAISSVGGGLTLNGTSTIVAPASPTGYQFTETQSLLGTASIVFDSIGNSQISEPRVFPVNFTTLTIGPSISISGSRGTVGQAFATVVMDGTINANVNAEAIVFAGSDSSGTGTLSANNGGIIRISGSFDNADATLNVDTAGGALEVLNGSALRNATFAGSAGTNFSFNPGSHTFEDVTVAADMTMQNGALVTITDGLTLNGTATILAPSSPTGLQFANDQVLDGAATIVFEGAGNSVVSEPRLLPFNFTTLTIASSVTIRGGVGTVGNVNATTIMNGTMSADTGRLEVTGSNLTNNGLMEAINGHTLEIDNLTASSGDLHAGPDSELLFLDAIGGLSASSDVLLDIGPSEVAGKITALTGVNSFAGTLTVSAVDGYSPGVGTGFTLIDQSDFAATIFGTVNSVGLGAGESFTPSYGEFAVTATVTN